MAKLPLILVLLAMFMLLYIPASLAKTNPAQHILVLNVRGGTHSISVYPDGRIVSSSRPANLYSLFRVQILHRSRITIEAMATESYVCMDEQGRLFTKKTEKSTRTTRTNVPGKKRKRRHPDPQHCIFTTHTFEQAYLRPMGIYMKVANSNGTRGRFLAFNKKGRPRKMEKPLKKLKMLHSIAVTFKKKFRMSDLINATIFQRKDGLNGTLRFNRGVRKCLRQSDLLPVPELCHQNLACLIEECVKSVHHQACLRRARRKKTWGGRSVMRQDSKQRHQRDLRSSNVSSNSMEVLLDPCRNLSPGKKEQG